MHIIGNYFNSGNCYEDYIFLIKLDTLLGGLVGIFYLLKKILCDDMCSVMIYVRSAELAVSLRAIFSGLVLELEKYGIILESLIGLGLLSLMVSVGAITIIIEITQ